MGLHDVWVYSLACCLCFAYRPVSCAQCPFDPCLGGDELNCPGGRICRPILCLHECVCTNTSTYPLCHKTEPTPGPSDGTTDHVVTVFSTGDPEKGKNCTPGYPCLNGQWCVGQWGMQCECYDGWHGIFCSESDVSTTPSLHSSTDFPKRNACSADYTLRPLAERQCPRGHLCLKGTCVEEDEEDRCTCDHGATGEICQNRCCRECGDHGKCFYDYQGEKEYCNCLLNYTGDYCEMYKPPHEAEADPTWHWWVVGVSGLVLVALLVILVLVPYVMWKHRVVLIMKIVHYFQQYEDDDEREWDVFVSYKSSPRDEKFVVHTLLPKLEDELGFKLNVHFRDFIIGMDIADNIVNAVQGSRRTILIISPKYVTSEWTKFEYQIAQQEMLNRKNRIIPILIDDISDCTSNMDPSLKMLLGSVTYLEYPNDDSDQKKSDKFWKRLQLTLPKKREVKEMSSSPKSTENYEIHVLHSKETETNGCVLKLSDSIKDTDDVYDIIDDSKLNIEFGSEHNKQESDTCINMPNGSTTHV